MEMFAVLILESRHQRIPKFHRVQTPVHRERVQSCRLSSLSALTRSVVQALTILQTSTLGSKDGRVDL